VPVLIALLALALLFGPTLWVRYVLWREGRDRPDLPGTGAELARHLLDEAGLRHVRVATTGEGDHYDPQTRAVRLLPQHHDGRSIAAVAVAAHEVAHAVQHAGDEPDFRRRTALATAMQPIHRASQVLFIALPVLGLATQAPPVVLLLLGLALALRIGNLALVALTLPVELDASFGKALPVLQRGRYLHPADLPAARRVLRAAAFTYVAGALGALVNVFRGARP
jgi:Zn-dependent membrane protease YugP